MTPRVIPASPSETVAWLELAESMWAHSQAEAKRLGLDPRGLAGGLMGMAIGQVSAIGNTPIPLSMMGAEVQDWPRALEIGGPRGGGPDLWKGRAVVQIAQDVHVHVQNTSDRLALFRGVLRVEVLPRANTGPCFFGARL